MSKDPKEAFDKGYADGKHRSESERKTGAVGAALGELFGPSSYRSDSDYPESYKEGFSQGKKNS